MRKIIYFHVCAVGNWYEVYKEIMDSIFSFGLIDESELNICVCGNIDDFKTTKNKYSHENICFSYIGYDISNFEFPTLRSLYIDALSDVDDTYYLYIHTKGVTRNESSVAGWRKYMTYFNVERWRDAVLLLDEYSAIGVDYQEADNFMGKVGWFAGNFWWTKSSHVKKLVDPGSYNDRLCAEFWLGTVDKDNFFTVWQSNNNHYQNYYPESSYKR